MANRRGAMRDAQADAFDDVAQLEIGRSSVLPERTMLAAQGPPAEVVPAPFSSHRMGCGAGVVTNSATDIPPESVPPPVWADSVAYSVKFDVSMLAHSSQDARLQPMPASASPGSVDCSARLRLNIADSLVAWSSPNVPLESVPPPLWAGSVAYDDPRSLNWEAGMLAHSSKAAQRESMPTSASPGSVDNSARLRLNLADSLVARSSRNVPLESVPPPLWAGSVAYDDPRSLNWEAGMLPYSWTDAPPESVPVSPSSLEYSTRRRLNMENSLFAKPSADVPLALVPAPFFSDSVGYDVSRSNIEASMVAGSSSDVQVAAVPSSFFSASVEGYDASGNLNLETSMVANSSVDVPLASILAPFSSGSVGYSARRSSNVEANTLAISSTDVPLESMPSLSSSGSCGHTSAFSGNAEASAVANSSTVQPSVGSSLHALGRCLPCRYHRHPDGCSKAESCQYCHHVHENWSLSKTQKNFRKHIAEYQAANGLSNSSSSRSQNG